MNLKEKQLTQEYLFKGKIINVRRDKVMLPNGNTSIREVIEHPGGVCVAPLTEDGQLLLVRQFRYPYREELLEIPAGKRDKGNEEPLETGRRELQEETGATAEKFIPLGTLYPTPGYCGEVIWMFAATGLTFGEQNPDEDEFLTVEKYPLDEVVQMILSGEITDAKTQAAVLKLKLLRDSGKIK